MTFPPQLRKTLLALAALAAALCLGGARQARATCGDYIHVGAHSQNSEAMAPDGFAPGDAHRTAFPAPFRKPCNGPQCRHAPAVPAPSPVVLPTQHEQAVILLGTETTPRLSPNALAGELSFLIARPLGSRLFRPPRMA